uniref:AbiV family abortive infection protein n=1 Tax=Streptosporangium sp. CA-256172 TaxID=3240076 RepID=UPI003F4936BC
MTVTYTKEQLRGLAEAALDNARELLENARLLQQSGSAGIARSLAVLSIEESGKALIAREAFEAEGTDFEERIKVLDRDLRRHPPKLEQICEAFERLHRYVSLIRDFVVGSTVEWNDPWTAELYNTAKQDGLYVGLEQGVVVTPSSVTRQDAQHVLDRAAVAIKLVEGLAESVLTIEGG